MCLAISAKVEGFDKEALEQLASQLNSDGWDFAVSKCILSFRVQPLLYFNGGPCACDRLSDGADWDAPTWAMTPDGANQLAREIASLALAADAPMLLQALGGGDEPDHTVSLTLQELCDLAAASRLGTRTAYRAVDFAPFSTRRGVW